MKSWSTSTNLIKLAKEVKARSGRGFAVFFDISNAYDTVDREKLFEILVSKKVLADAELEVLKFIFDNLSIKLGKHIYKPTRGLPQGLSISPLLFNIYINDILKKCEENGMFALAFADDFVMIGKDENSITASVNCFSRFCDCMNLKINSLKSGILQLGNRNQVNWRTSINDIPIVDNYKYLGVQLSGKIYIEPYLEHTVSKVER